MEPFRRTQSFYQQDDQSDGNDQKNNMNHSHSFAYGSHTGGSFHDFSELKASIGKLSSIDQENDFSDIKSPSNQVDQFQKSYSFYDTINEDDKYTTSRPSINSSHSFAFGSNNYDTFHGFSGFKSSINRFGRQDPIKEEVYESGNLFYFLF